MDMRFVTRYRSHICMRGDRVAQRTRDTEMWFHVSKLDAIIAAACAAPVKNTLDDADGSHRSGTQ